MAKGTVLISREALRGLIFGGLQVDLDDIKLTACGRAVEIAVHGLDVPESEIPLRSRKETSEHRYLEPNADDWLARVG
jgi:hypothetical protein